MSDTEKAALEQRIDELCQENEQLRQRITTQKQTIQSYRDESREWREVADHANDENAKLREQIELLVTLLRNDCDIEASWDGLRRFWYIGLTENGCLMRDRACKAEAENAQLREQLDYMTPIALYAASEQERDRMRNLGIEGK